VSSPTPPPMPDPAPVPTPPAAPAQGSVPVPAPVAPAAKSRLPSGFATLRDLVSFVFGAAIVVNEVFLSPTVEAAAVGVGIAFCGLPLVFGADAKKKE